METISTYNLSLDAELTNKCTMFFSQNYYIRKGLSISKSETLHFLLKRFNSDMDNNFYALAESRLKDMYTLVGIDFNTI